MLQYGFILDITSVFSCLGKIHAMSIELMRIYQLLTFISRNRPPRRSRQLASEAMAQEAKSSDAEMDEDVEADMYYYPAEQEESSMSGISSQTFIVQWL